MYTGCGNRHFLILGLITAIVLSLLRTISVAAEIMDLPDSSKLDLTQKCPVCGMIIGGQEGQGAAVTYKDGREVGFRGVAAAVFKDAHVVGFEGARCLFIYNSVPEKYDIKVSDIAHQWVTDFVSKKMIELPTAFLVLGSNVKGPMGYDLIPFAKREEAAKFATKNDGKWIVQLHEVSKAQEETSRTGGPEMGTSVLHPPVEPNTIQPRESSGERTRKRLPQQRPDESERRGGGHHGMH